MRQTAQQRLDEIVHAAGVRRQGVDYNAPEVVFTEDINEAIAARIQGKIVLRSSVVFGDPNPHSDLSIASIDARRKQ